LPIIRCRPDQSFISALEVRISMSFSEQKKPSGGKALERLDI
jgi:hypothetical protein